MKEFENIPNEIDSDVKAVEQPASREISTETIKAIEEARDPKVLKIIEKLSLDVDLADKSKNIEPFSRLMRGGQWYPICHYGLKNHLIDPNELYKIFLPIFDLNNNPGHPVGLRYLLSLLLRDRLLNMEQINNFIDKLIENSDVEVIWTVGREGPVEPTNKRVKGMKIDDDFEGELESTETVNPNEAAHTMLYGNSKTWKDDVVEYLTFKVKHSK